MEVGVCLIFQIIARPTPTHPFLENSRVKFLKMCVCVCVWAVLSAFLACFLEQQTLKAHQISLALFFGADNARFNLYSHCWERAQNQGIRDPVRLALRPFWVHYARFECNLGVFFGIRQLITSNFYPLAQYFDENI